MRVVKFDCISGRAIRHRCPERLHSDILPCYDSTGTAHLTKLRRAIVIARLESSRDPRNATPAKSRAKYFAASMTSAGMSSYVTLTQNSANSSVTRRSTIGPPRIHVSPGTLCLSGQSHPPVNSTTC